MSRFSEICPGFMRCVPTTCAKKQNSPGFLHVRKEMKSSTRILEASFLGPTVFRGPRNFEPSRGSWVPPGFYPRDFTTEFVFYRGNPRDLTFFIRTTIFSQKMTSK